MNPLPELLVPLVQLTGMRLAFLPVICTAGECPGWGGVVYDASGLGPDPIVLATSRTFGGEAPQRWPREHFAANFAEETVRDRAARDLAVRVRVPVASTAPGWKRQPTGWALTGYGVGTFFAARPSQRFPEGHPRLVPRLDELDPNDPTRLPDGSHLVDARALALVTVHILRLRP